jgi:hypothetical protein
MIAATSGDKPARETLHRKGSLAAYVSGSLRFADATARAYSIGRF